ncbi:hypothetical protein D9M72_582340 [compost metagenome]
MRLGERANHWRAVPAASAQMLSDTSAISRNTAPRLASCSGIPPAEYSTNWGSTATKNTSDFGLVEPTMNPCRRTRKVEAEREGSAAVVLLPWCLMAWIPRNTR